MEIFMKFRASEEFRDRIKLLCKLKNKTISTMIREYFEKEFKKHKI
ncbi:MAG: hypothetical protein ACRCZ2_05150 [Fusobacteriaceae bacterium]